MKRLIGMLLCTACIGATLFAADPVIRLQARTKANLVTVDFDDEQNNQGVNLGGDDEFGIEYKDQNAGARISLSGNLAGTVSIADYFGWMKFGNLTMTAGETDSRYANRVNADASSWGVWEKFYFGPILNGTLKGESDNIAAWKQSEFFADYALENVLISFGTGNDVAASKYHVQESFSARAAYKLADVGALNLTYNQKTKDSSIIGVFGHISSIQNLLITGGYSAYFDFEEETNAIHALELRAGYKTGAISLTSHNNFSFAEDCITMYNMGNAAYKISDIVTGALYVMNINTSGDLSSKTNTLTIRPGMTITAQKGATIDIGPEFTMKKIDEADITTVMTLPVVFRVKF